MPYSFRYVKFDQDLAKLIATFKSLQKLFQHLVLQVGGDAEEALRVMEMLQDRGYIDPNVDLQSFRRQLEDHAIIRVDQDRAVMAPRGVQQIRKDSLNEIFTSLRKGGSGEHRTPNQGDGGDRLPEVRPYQFGDDVSSLDPLTSISNAVRRSGIENISIQEDDLAVYETEHHSSCATAMLIDVSHSMILYGEDRMTPAKKVAIALAELIQTQYPKDSLDVILFGDDATLVRKEDLPYISAGPYHTNTKAGLKLAQRVLRRRKHSNKQIFMVTDGKPSALWEGGRLYKNPMGLDTKIVNKTLDEAAACRRAGISITTFMVATDPWLVEFVEKLTAVNKGKAYFTSTDRLGEYLFVDYIRNRRRRVR